MIKLWGRKNAYNVQKVLWSLQELAIDFQHRDVGSHPGDLDTKEFRAINPHGRIPVIQDGDQIIWESNTIVRYLYRHYGDSNALSICAKDEFCASLLSGSRDRIIHAVTSNYCTYRYVRTWC